MSALGDMIRGYESEIETLKKALEEITSMPFRSNKPYDLMDAVQVAMEALEKTKKEEIKLDFEQLEFELKEENLEE